MVWNGKKRGGGKSKLGAPHGLPLSPISFLIWMAPSIRKMEIAIKAVTTYDNELSLYVDDLHVNIYNRNMIHIDVELLLQRIEVVVNQVARENHLPLRESKHQTLVLRKKRSKKIRTRSG